MSNSTPEQKAQELVDKFDESIGLYYSGENRKYAAKFSAIVCVEQILSTHVWPRKLEFWQSVLTILKSK